MNQAAIGVFYSDAFMDRRLEVEDVFDFCFIHSDTVIRNGNFHIFRKIFNAPCYSPTFYFLLIPMVNGIFNQRLDREWWNFHIDIFINIPDHLQTIAKSRPFNENISIGNINRMFYWYRRFQVHDGKTFL